MQKIDLLHSSLRIHTLIALLALLLSPQLEAALPSNFNPRLRFIQDTTEPYATGVSDNIFSKKNADVEKYIPLIVSLKDPSAKFPEGVYEWRRRGNLALVTVKSQDLYKLAEWEYASRIEASRVHTPSMNLALEWCDMPSLHKQTLGEGIPLTGNGVVVGFCDTGFDPNHINFTPADGDSRVKKLVNATIYAPYPMVIDQPKEIALWQTDNTAETHATHVCGILAGGYDHDGVIGVAPEAEIVSTTSDLYDAFILDGIEQILEYAKEQEKPGVVNISVSSAIGPHDGTTLFNEYIAQLAEEIPICISAGNDGNRPGTIYHTFTDDTPLRFYPVDWPTWIRNYASGAIDIWTDKSEDITLNFVEIDNTTHEIKKRWSGIPLADFDPVVVCSDSESFLFPEIKYEKLPEQFSGYFYAISEINPQNNRYNVLVELSFNDLQNLYPASPTSNIGIELIGRPGTKVEIYSTSHLYLNKNYDPCGVSGSSFNAINDFCMKGNVICVGSFNTRDYIPHLDAAATPRPQSPIGEISYFSSYGVRPDGTNIPDVVAPGAYIVSSISTPFVNSFPQSISSYVSSQADIDGKIYYWGPDQGTSMASPYTAGTVALWLERYPQLEPGRIREILRETSAIPQGATDASHWGVGMLNALEGYKMAGMYTSSSILPVGDSLSELSVKYSDGGVYIIAPADRSIEPYMFSLSGAAMPQTIFRDIAPGILFINFKDIPPGIYLLDSPGFRPVKIAVRR